MPFALLAVCLPYTTPHIQRSIRPLFFSLFFSLITERKGKSFRYSPLSMAATEAHISVTHGTHTQTHIQRNQVSPSNTAEVGVTLLRLGVPL